jgi:hypothetical protein
VIDEVRSLVDIFGDYEFTFWVLIDFLGDLFILSIITLSLGISSCAGLFFSYFLE